MILPAQAIRAASIITPFHERTTFEGMTFGLGPSGYDVRIAEDLILYANTFHLASTIEHFDMPHDVLGIVHDKSTWARLGLCVQNTVIEPGWRGFLTVELTNHNISDIRIARGMSIAQIIFHRLEAPTEQPYKGKYQEQQPGPQQARFD